MKIFVRGDRTAVVTVESGYAVEALRSAVEGATGTRSKILTLLNCSAIALEVIECCPSLHVQTDV